MAATEHMTITGRNTAPTRVSRRNAWWSSPLRTRKASSFSFSRLKIWITFMPDRFSDRKVFTSVSLVLLTW